MVWNQKSFSQTNLVFNIYLRIQEVWKLFIQLKKLAKSIKNWKVRKGSRSKTIIKSGSEINEMENKATVLTKLKVELWGEIDKILVNYHCFHVPFTRCSGAFCKTRKTKKSLND